MVITRLDQLDPIQGIYTYADYLLWKFEERVELIKGKIFKMASPSATHQRIVRRLSTKLDLFLEGKTCELFISPFDVVLPIPHKTKENTENTVVQPDLCVVCDPSKIEERACKGAPDLVVEILSPGNSKKEIKEKFELYEQAGVLEYWVIYPAEKTIHIYVLDGDKYRGLAPVADEEMIHSVKFPTLQINTKDIFI